MNILNMITLTKQMIALMKATFFVRHKALENGFRIIHVSTTSKGRPALFSNPLILIGIASELALLAAIALPPLGHAIFGTAPFDAGYLPLMLLFGAIILACEEGRKYLYRSRGIFSLE